MRRRAFLCQLGGIAFVALAPGVAADAQQPEKTYRVVFLTASTPPHLFEAFRQRLRELGWIEGGNLMLDFRSAQGRIDRIPALVAELMQQKVDLVVLTATAVHGAKKATATVPVVFVTTDDPVRTGLVTSFARPGGRMTGLTSLNVDLDAKRLEILKTTLPGVVRVGVLSTPQDFAHGARLAAIERAAAAMSLELQILEVANADGLARAFDAATRGRVKALIMIGSPILLVLQPRIVNLAMKARLPVISAWREFPEAGGLMSYGTNVTVMFQRAASFVDRILKGANPGEIPVEQAATFELVINVKTARALGVDIPPSMLLRADRVIE